jgi:histone deacetylase complex regulatory component SIN3
MGGKVNLYLDDQSLNRWHSLPSGIRSQVVRQALLNQNVDDPMEREKLLIQEKKRKLTTIEKEIMMLNDTKATLISEITELESKTNFDQIEIPESVEIPERYELANMFWRQMVEAAPMDEDFMMGFKPSKIMTMGKRTGCIGLEMYFAIRKDFARVHMYIYNRKNVQKTMRMYEHFKQRKNQIEEDFGEPLIWQESSKTARRIVHRVDGIDIRDDRTWPNAIEEMIDSMERLWKALKPHISTLKDN